MWSLLCFLKARINIFRLKLLIIKVFLNPVKWDLFCERHSSMLTPELSYSKLKYTADHPPSPKILWETFLKIMLLCQQHLCIGVTLVITFYAVCVWGCTFMSVCDGRLNSASLSISSIDSLASTFCVCPLPVITCPVRANYSPVSDYIVRWLELGKHEMEVTLILIQVFNGVFYLRVSLLSHFRWAASLRADCPGRSSL